MRLKLLLLYSLLFSVTLHADYRILIYDKISLNSPNTIMSCEKYDDIPRQIFSNGADVSIELYGYKNIIYTSNTCLNNHNGNSLISCETDNIWEVIVTNGYCKYQSSGIQNSTHIKTSTKRYEKLYGTYEGTPPDCPSNQLWSDEEGGCVNAPPLECTENELLNENNECVPFDSLMPDDFPNDLDSNGQTSTGTVPTTEQGCKDLERYSSSLGMVEVLGWDYQSQTCKVVAFKCNQGRVLDANTNKCIIPPDNANLGGGDICPNDNWARRWTHDFCGDCVGGVGVWLPPLGHEESGMQCNKAYIEYQCVKDYRIKKYMEVSCGDPIPNENETNHIDMNNLNPSQTVDQNISNLPAIDPTNANLAVVENLRAIESAIKDNLSPKIDTVNQNLVNTNDKLSNISNQIGDSNSKLNGIKSSLDSINDTLNTTGEGINPSDMDLDDSGLDDTKSIMDNFADNVSELTSGITSIEEKFTETKALLSGKQPIVNIPSGSCSNEHLNKFATYILPYNSIFSLVVYVGFMISIFKMIFAYMSRGE